MSDDEMSGNTRTLVCRPDWKSFYAWYNYQATVAEPNRDESNSAPKIDLFICHASEDKADLVRPLANYLVQRGCTVWYDELSLRGGDSLIETINRGIAKSRNGLIVLSKAFFDKPWPNRELRALTTGELLGRCTIIPAWKGISHSEVADRDLSLADKMAVVCDGREISAIGDDLLSIVRPDLQTAHLRRAAFDAATKDNPVVEMKLDDIDAARPVVHETLPKDLVTRIRLLRIVLLEVYPLPLQDWLAAFQRDAHPTRELHLWEQIASAYSELRVLFQGRGIADCSIFNLVMKASFRSRIDFVAKHTSELSESDLTVIWGATHCPVSVLDVEIFEHVTKLSSDPVFDGIFPVQVIKDRDDQQDIDRLQVDGPTTIDFSM